MDIVIYIESINMLELYYMVIKTVLNTMYVTR
jgi:hypothetical protein